MGWGGVLCVSPSNDKRRDCQTSPLIELEAIFAIALHGMLCPFSLHLSALFSFMAPYDAARRGPQESMMHRVMAGDAPYQSTLKTALGAGGRYYR